MEFTHSFADLIVLLAFSIRVAPATCGALSAS